VITGLGCARSASRERPALNLRSVAFPYLGQALAAAEDAAAEFLQAQLAIDRELKGAKSAHGDRPGAQQGQHRGAHRGGPPAAGPAVAAVAPLG